MTARPLAGKRIVITRARAQSGALRSPLEQLGAEVIEVPTIEIRDPDSWAPLDNALRRLEEFDFLILTSVNGVRKLLERLKVCGRSVADLARLDVGAIGPATATELERAGVRVAFLPKTYQAEGLLEVLEGRDLQGKSFLIPRAKVARDLVPRELAARGARVEVVEAYQTVLPASEPGSVKRLLSPAPDLVTFTSSSTAANFAQLLGEHGFQSLASFKAASIGPIASDTARRLGFQIVVEAEQSTMAGLVAAISQYFARNSKGRTRKGVGNRE